MSYRVLKKLQRKTYNIFKPNTKDTTKMSITLFYSVYCKFLKIPYTISISLLLTLQLLHLLEHNLFTKKLKFDWRMIYHCKMLFQINPVRLSDNPFLWFLVNAGEAFCEKSIRCKQTKTSRFTKRSTKTILL